eukprot:g1375.t1
MIFGLFRRRSRDAEHRVYVEIVAQARQPVFYTDFLVPDTIDGRFDLLIVHAVLFFRRLRGEGRDVAEFSQNVFDLFFEDMDASLREMGVSDTRVPKKVKVMGEAFYGRADAYIPALDEGNVEVLAEALGRNIFTDAPEPLAQTRLAHYMLQAAKDLETQSAETLRTGEIRWPDAERYKDLAVNASKVVDKDEKITVQPDAASRQAIAAAYDLNAIPDLTAHFTLKPYRKAGVRVVGPVKMTINQTCVVSLEPFDSSLELEVDRTFEPHSSRPRKIRDLNEEGEIEIDLESLDPPDVILDGVLDLGAVICEELALSLDAFPRKDGAAFEGGDDDEEEAAEEVEEKPSPFAALQALKDQPENGK